VIELVLLLIALPQYGQGSGRTCGNCHISPTYQDPNGWNNPELAERKCNLSCIVCHVNPTGGGLRNTSGRYFGQSTLSMIPLQERSYSDYGREVLPQDAIRAIRNAFAWKPESSSGEHTIPSSWTEVEAGIGSGQRGGFSSFGSPLFGGGEYSLWDGRYGDLIADPLLQIGGDLRLAYFSTSRSFFPMQADLHAALQPIEHLTLVGTLAARGRASGFAGTVAQEQTPVFVKDAFLMVHELPFMAYVKGGLFLPPFGTYIDDHTSYIREYFEMDVSQSHDQVLGIEVGAAPNYPFTSIAFFRNLSPAGTPEGTDPGWGGSMQIGWRDLWYSIQAHGMIKRRDLAARGDLDAAGISFSFNPFYFSNSVPLTYLGEVSFGRRQRELTGTRTTFIASYHELWITIFNGINARLKYDVGDRDLVVRGELEHRLSAALDISPYPGLTFVGQGRLLFAQGLAPSPDLFLHLHLWF
jgi:hypothetical protein